MLKEGHGYIMAQSIAAQIAGSRGDDCISTTANFNQLYGNKEYKSQDLSGKTLVIWRTGGAGDLLFLSPSIKMLKKIYPTCKIALATSAKYADIFKYFEYADDKYILPLDEEIIRHADYWAIFEGLIETAKSAETENAYDIFATRLGVIDQMTPSDKQPILKVTTTERNWADGIIKKHSSSVGCIGIQVSASAVVRSFDAGSIRDMALYFTSNGYSVFMFGGFRDADPIDLLIKTAIRPKGIINMAKMGASWTQSAALIEHMDLMITPDSSLAHIAAAMGTPALGIFGPFVSDVRFRYYKNVVAIDANAMCPPCFQHGQLPCRWIQDPHESAMSKCFECIKTDLVIDVASQMLAATNNI